MKYRVLDAVYCAKCEKPFKVANPQSNAVTTPEAPLPRCSYYCAFLGVEPDKDFSGDCGGCFSREIISAELVCESCGAVFCVKDGIPVFLNEGGDRGASENSLVEQTRDRFGFQWRHFRKTDEDEDTEYFREIAGVGAEEFFGGRVVLDAGCGGGRLTGLARRFGAREVFAFDFSRAAERAAKEYAGDPFVHVLRCDIFNLPFRPGYFDSVYSLGVIHHTPDPRAAFSRLARQVKGRGRLLVWVYEDTGWRNYPTDYFWRSITTRLPRTALYYLCYIAVPLGLLERLRFSRNPLARAVGEFFYTFFRVSIKRNWSDRVLGTFDCYAPRHAFRIKDGVMKRWFEDNGFDDLKRTSTLSYMGRKSNKP